MSRKGFLKVVGEWREISGEVCMFQCELAMVLYPVFVHMYLELVYNNHEDHGE